MQFFLDSPANIYHAILLPLQDTTTHGSQQIEADKDAPTTPFIAVVGKLILLVKRVLYTWLFLCV